MKTLHLNKIVSVLCIMFLLCSCQENTKKIAENVNSVQQSISLNFNNDSFYKEGKFDVNRAKDAILQLMKYHNYPIYPNIKDKIWVSDYGTGKFAEVGIAVVMWRNHKEEKYMLMDIFLLPNQMLPEHLHAEQSDKHIPAKAEGWLVRHGTSYVAGIGENNLSDFSFKIPQIHNNGNVAAQHVIKATEGMFLDLQNPKTSPYHWQIAGDRGAIFSEVAINHSSSNVKYRDVKMHEFIYGR